LSWIKWILLVIVIAAVGAGSIYLYVEDESNNRAIQEVEIGLQSANIGSIRDGEAASLSKKDTVANLVLDVVRKQKENGRDVRLDYVFMDNEGNVTDAEEDIRSVQFRVSLLDEDGSTASAAETRISLDELVSE
jgi:hypothetical protein